ncbi:conserved hypothetical protein [Leishmania major strain Friedlin]|uniref:PSI domain-containing protein n=1 Tax=Leishmania major TaxID=5664 RepID=E9ACB7_LEIMA|nr:conserved hypothetical protein [Leishmania major strain Friedlin]CAG9567193.1 hypothetical_protein_-_conserved [Leishmania major strain Friedlin]CBZ11932.1 conserved hypothetical protein [Leishmania major strain Friedlin]|eukprot:XP_003721648.1 conserved hypothetical protein [Leishmania major strain Friedlin]
MGVASVKRRGGFRRDEDRRLRLSRRCGATVAVVMVFLRLLSGTSPVAHAFNVCADISRCSECVFDQTDGLMPPPLMCGWCESTQTCKEINSTVLSYYRTTLATGGAGDAEVEHTPDEVAAFREQFCEDFRERNFNAVCPDMFCAASKTTNNIYICRAPSIAALVLGCILFVLSILLYTWMQTIHQLPWKYEPFLSDLLAGRHRPPDPAGDDGDTEAIVDDCRDTAAVPHITLPSAVQRGHSAASPFLDRDGGTEDFGERGSDDGDGGVSSSSTAQRQQQQQQQGQHALLHRAASIVTTTAATGYCPICRCRHPVPLGPGNVCFWCNVARFAFVPVSLVLLSSSIVIVLSFAVSLKPWFADAYFAEVLVVAYLSFGGFVWYVVRHHRRAPLFYVETEEEREANEEVWPAARHRRPTSRLPSAAAGAASITGSASEVERESMPSPLHSRNAKLQLLNDARRNMASTTYLRLALRLRGRSLLDQIPELKKYRAQIASMHLAPATLTRVGGALSAMCTPMTAAMAGSGAYGGDAGTTVVTTATAAATSAVAAAGAPMTPVTRADVDATAATPTASMPSCLSLPLQRTRLPQHPTPLPSAVAAAAVGSTDTAGVMAASAFSFDAQTSPAAAAATGSASATVATSAAAATPMPLATTLPDRVARQKRAETAQLLNSDFLSPQYRKALKATLFRDELITWYSEPRLRSVLMENKWLLLDLLAGLLFGIWMLMLSSVSDKTFAIVRLSGSTAVAACGLVVVLGFALLLVVVVRSCGRLYVLTDERLITVYESIIEPVVTATDLSSVRFAALYGYHGIWAREPVLDFSWEVPATERKMPAIKSHKFSGITDLHEFLYYFRMMAPQTPFHLQQISESTRQDRAEWRMHVILCIGLFVALPIITVYPHAVPDFLAAYLYVVALLLIGSTLLRGLRAQQMTCAPLNIAASWAPAPARNEVDGAEPLQPLPPSVVTHAPDGCSAPKTTASSFGGHGGSQELGTASVSPISVPM